MKSLTKCFKITPGMPSALPDNSVFMNKIEANDLMQVRHFISPKIKVIVVKSALRP